MVKLQRGIRMLVLVEGKMNGLSKIRKLFCVQVHNVITMFYELRDVHVQCEQCESIIVGDK